MLTRDVRTALIKTTPSQKVGERFYRPELDVLRFIAFFSVFNFHFSFLMRTHFPGQRVLAGVGAYGMSLFFYLSSYLITELLLRERSKSGTVHIGAFFMRRILRIWPLYFAFIGFTVLLGYIYPHSRIELPRVVALVLLAGNWYMARHGVDSSPASPLWSISLEEQFYLVWPFLARFGGSRGLGAVSVLLIPLAWLILALHRGMGILDKAIWCNSFVQFQFFAFGALTALTLRHRSPRWSARTRMTILLTGACLWLAASKLEEIWYLQGMPAFALITIYTLMGIGCVCFLVGLLGISCDLIPGWAVYLGQISYGLYVFHEMNLVLVHRGLSEIAMHTSTLQHAAIFDLAEFIFSLALTICAAALSYRFYERKFLLLKERFAFVKSRAA